MIKNVLKHKLILLLKQQTSQNIFCGIRLGGMGVAIGSLIGKELAELLN